MNSQVDNFFQALTETILTLMLTIGGSLLVITLVVHWLLKGVVSNEIRRFISAIVWLLFIGFLAQHGYLQSIVSYS
jgi:hypothetical protein